GAVGRSRTGRTEAASLSFERFAGHGQRRGYIKARSPLNKRTSAVRLIADAPCAACDFSGAKGTKPLDASADTDRSGFRSEGGHAQWCPIGLLSGFQMEPGSLATMREQPSGRDT